MPLPALTVLIVLPLALAAVAFAVPSERLRPFLLPVGALAHFALTLAAVAAIAARGPAAGTAWLAVDPLGGLALLVVSGLFTICALYAPGYLLLRIDRNNRVFVACLFVFLGMASAVTLAQHLGLLWVTIELTTLATAPLLYFNRNARSLEAAWKYLVIGSVGIALALLGSFFVAYAAHLSRSDESLFFTSLNAAAGTAGFSRPWLRAGFVFLLVGYGTKMGLAPLHTWKPDAYGEAPGIVGALLAGGMTTCAFLALLRVYAVLAAAGEGAFARQLLVFLGLLSLGFAAAFMVRQGDLKRMLAYSSVEHMGILALGIGLGGAGIFGALLHTVNNALTKAVMFLAAANIHRAYGSKNVADMSGAMARLPVSGTLFLLGFFALSGSPPFGPFLSEFTILNAAIGTGRYAIAAAFLVLLGVIFIGMGATVLGVVQGSPGAAARRTPYVDRLRKTFPILLAMGLVLLLGLWIPAPLERLLREAARSLEVRP
ncbi:MAG TPA: proton-conducting transporter membrane subunit [Thermoanaerobaculia bacterium]|nr:proton-conducting transporter membrane subunit [Thermoanaerobaculia bacterium]